MQAQANADVLSSVPSPAAGAAGKAKYTLVKLMRLTVDGILSSSIQPLRVASYLGVIVSLLAFLGAVFTLLQRIFAEQFAALGLRPVPGFATIVIGWTSMRCSRRTCRR